MNALTKPLTHFEKIAFSTKVEYPHLSIQDMVHLLDRKVLSGLGEMHEAEIFEDWNRASSI